MSDSRKQQLTEWVNGQLCQLHAEPGIKIDLSTVSGDASFRRYFRAQIDAASYIAVDAPPENENSELFVEIAGYIREAGVKSPEVYAQNLEQGFLLIEDFGDQLYLPRLIELQGQAQDAEAEHQIEQLYTEAIAALLKIQSGVNSQRLAPYDRAKLRSEMQLFEDWFCVKFLGLDLSEGERKLIADCFSLLEEAALEQTQLAVHRDFHSRNLLILDNDRFNSQVGPGVIDFQDAMSGAYTYDLMSLLRDCYIRWSPAFVEKMALSYFQLANEAGLIAGISSAQFLRDLDIMGLQRNFKVMGIFTRLAIRDNKPQYLADIPLVIQYFLEVACKYEEMAPFLNWFETTVLPKATLNLEL